MLLAKRLHFFENCCARNDSGMNDRIHFFMAWVPFIVREEFNKDEKPRHHEAP
jgi:hypothetical protein